MMNVLGNCDFPLSHLQNNRWIGSDKQKGKNNKEGREVIMSEGLRNQGFFSQEQQQEMGNQGEFCSVTEK